MSDVFKKRLNGCTVIAIVPCYEMGDWIGGGLFLQRAHVLNLRFDKQLRPDERPIGHFPLRRYVDAREERSTSIRETRASQRTQLFPLKSQGIHVHLGSLAANPAMVCKARRVAL